MGGVLGVSTVSPASMGPGGRGAAPLAGAAAVCGGPHPGLWLRAGPAVRGEGPDPQDVRGCAPTAGFFERAGHAFCWCFFFRCAACAGKNFLRHTESMVLVLVETQGGLECPTSPRRQ